MIEKKIQKRKKKFFEVLRYTFILVTCFLAFRSTVFEPFMIPSGSMIPTLRIGDFILVNKFTYGVKLPFSDLAIFDFNLNPVFLFGKKSPQRGDMVVFKYPKDPSINYIKRVIGVPGDTIEIKDKIVFINGKPLSIREISGTSFLKDMDKRYRGNKFKFYSTKLENKEFVIQQDIDNIYTSFLDKVEIPKGSFFVMGDNRDFSSDSREWGFVPRQYIKGKAVLIWFSMTLPGHSDVFEIRARRIFKALR